MGISKRKQHVKAASKKYTMFAEMHLNDNIEKGRYTPQGVEP